MSMAVGLSPTLPRLNAERKFTSALRARFAPLLLGLLLLFAPACSRADTTHDVVIVGAGAAGMYAAYTLDNLGFSVLVLEAQDHRGGRVHNVNQEKPGFWTASAEICAEWVEGNQNYFFRDDVLANFPGRLVSAGGRTVYEDYPNGNESDLYDYWDFYYHIFEPETHGPTVSYKSDLANHGGVTDTDPEYHLYTRYASGIWFAELDDLYIQDLRREEELWTYGSGGLVFAESGFLQTLDELYFNQIIPLVQLNSPVTAIDTSGPQPFATAAGQNHYANAIIVTVSVGVLRNNHITFNPVLPSAKVAALGTLNMTPGSGAAVVMLKWANNDHWPSNTRYINGNGAGNMCWFQGYYKNIPNNEKVVSKCIIGPDTYAEHLEGLTEQQQIDAVANDIIDMFPGLTLGDVVDSYLENLGENPYFEGGYSSPGQGSRPDTGPSARQVYAEQVGTSLYFAGEGTKDNGAGSVSGALDSGLRAALEVDADHNPGTGGPAPTAEFSASVTSGTAPLSVTFSDLSIDVPTSWLWDFGEVGATSTDQNPIFEYTTEGTYTVSLTATNANGFGTMVKTNLISVPEPAAAIQLAAGIFGLIGLIFHRRRLLVVKRSRIGISKAHSAPLALSGTGRRGDTGALERGLASVGDPSPLSRAGCVPSLTCAELVRGRTMDL